MKIQVLYFEGCPNYKPALDLVRSLAPAAIIEEIEIKSQQEAERLRFLGSPTILVDGVDVEPSARGRTDFGFTCRTYGGMGLPSRKLIVTAIACSARQSIEQSPGHWLSASSIVVAATASACCWIPVVLLAVGMSAGQLSPILESFRPWLLVGTAILLATAFYSAYKKESCCTPQSRRLSRAMVWMAAASVLAFALFPLYAGSLIDVEGPACCTSPVSSAAPSEQKSSVTVLSADAHELKDAFNADKADVKVILIVSPRCPACRRGADVVQKKALAQIDSDKLKVYVVWINRFFGDSQKAAQEATELVSDKRAQHFWDGSGALGKQYGKIIELPHDKKFAWDVYFVFGTNAVWAENPPSPAFWMHQLGGPETGNLLDGAKFREAIVKQLPKRD